MESTFIIENGKVSMILIPSTEVEEMIISQMSQCEIKVVSTVDSGLRDIIKGNRNIMILEVSEKETVDKNPPQNLFTKLLKSILNLKFA